MPQPPLPGTSETPIAEVDTARWLSHHLFTAGDRNALLTQIVGPAAVELLDGGIIDRFFFIRYAENGPHLRFRVRLAADVEPALAAEKTLAALRRPRQPRPQEGDAETHAPLVLDPGDIRPAEFELETERYGGPAHFPHSLEFFVLSSLDAVEFVTNWGSKRRSVQLVETLTRLARYALGFARDREELLALADYAAHWREQMAPIVARAESMYEHNGAALSQRIQAVLNQAALPGDDDAEGDAGPAAANPLQVSVAHAQTLAASVDDLDDTRRRTVLGSQLHMAANRLGLTNPEEVYLSVLLSRCLEGLYACPEDLDAALLSRSAAPTPSEAARGLTELAERGLRQLVASHAVAAAPE
ncbi:lantibiotic dehydratase C-terminal domain-containing protein [Haliangium ochraceum]|uniref:Thiopeptide-type bacteriocin biosynthesis domain-containing protein n=1 Tax=Haliangium ochraceum (strain DSM 14365 / JCM 11303 / SMP-2) TaxID=502025 RepID=D0LVQ9_HALO1|nr:lantibiotic dehydratase C-terminal domain-containing protein [Haliangium ochraceum]ACY14043.1 hypothetical protein Hoch_1491 [Haliangium ochraceum DSM 14365]